MFDNSSSDDSCTPPFRLSSAKESKELSTQGGDGEHSKPYFLERYDERTIISAGDETAAIK
jgi:hypothetical protein